MKTIQTKEMREVVITTYIAKDGKEFDLKSDCIAYEEALDNELLDRYNAIPRTEANAEDCYLPTWYSSCEQVHIIRIRDEQDAETLTKWVGRYSGDTRKLTADDIGRVVMLVYEEYPNYAMSDYCDVLFYEEDVLKQAQEFWQNVNKAEIA